MNEAVRRRDNSVASVKLVSEKVSEEVGGRKRRKRAKKRTGGGRGRDNMAGWESLVLAFKHAGGGGGERRRGGEGERGKEEETKLHSNPT